MMPTIDLLYDDDCPFVERTRIHLAAALRTLKFEPRWCEHKIGSSTVPPYARGYGSPTVMIDGRDAAGMPPNTDASCRIYVSAERTLSAVPSVEQLTMRLREASSVTAQAVLGAV
jgi:mercuric ion transport protein